MWPFPSGQPRTRNFLRKKWSGLEKPIIRVVTSRRVKISFPLFFSFFFSCQTTPAKLASNDIGFNRRLFSAQCIYPPLFRPCALYLKLFRGYLVLSRDTLLGEACFVAFHVHFILTLTLVECRRSVCLHWFLAVTRRRYYVGPH